MQACRHAGMQACRRQPAGIPCRHLAGIPWMPAHPAGIPSNAAGIPQAASRHPGAIPQPSCCWRMLAHPAGRGRTGPVPRGSDFKGSLRELKALEQTFPFGQHPSGEVKLFFLEKFSRFEKGGEPKWRTTLVKILFLCRGCPSMLPRGRIFILLQH